MRSSFAILVILAGCGMPADSPLPVPTALPVCMRCHGAQGPGIEFNDSTWPALAGAIVQALQSGAMPPDAPGPLTPPIIGSVAITYEQRAELVAYVQASGPLVSSQAKPPDVPARASDLDLRWPGAYALPPSGANEYRCAIVDGAAGRTITAYRWRSKGSHHETGLILSAAGAVWARSHSGADGRTGYECLGGGPPQDTVLADLGSASAGPAAGQSLPPGVGATVPPDGALIMQVHYSGPAAQGDVPGVQLWTTADAVRQIRQVGVNAPVELPCPLGVSTDPRNPCSREFAIGRSGIQPAAVVRAYADKLVMDCGAPVHEPFARAVPGHFLVATECVGALPSDVTIYEVHGHAHTQAVSLSADIEEGGQWVPLLDLPTYDWRWHDRAYAYKTPIQGHAGQRLRVRCVHDNGAKVQWSLVTGEPSGPPPLADTSAVVYGYSKRDDMCNLALGVADR